MNIVDKVASDLNIPLSLVAEALANAQTHVKKFYINKRSGGKRTIYHPSKKLKIIQYWVIHNILKKIPIHSAAMGFQEGSSILQNAQKHRLNRFFLKVDLKDFFPSITFYDIEPKLKDTPIQGSSEVVKIACFDKESRLPIGYPSSPIISNIVMFEFDNKISDLVASETFGNATYTRYADDLVFSTNETGKCRKILTEVSNLIKSNTSPKIRLNIHKTKIGSSTGGSASVTGLKMCPDGHITLNKKQKDHIRLLLSLYRKKILKAEEFVALQGHLSFAKHVAPAFYTTLCKKYFIEIEELKKAQRGEK